MFLPPNRSFFIAAALMMSFMGSVAAAQHAGIASPPPSVIELAPFTAPTINGWALVREVHKFHDTSYCAVNILYAAKGQEKLQLYESTRPVHFLATAGPYWIFWDTKLAHMGALIFVVYVPAEGKPFVVFQSQQLESRVDLRDELMSCQFSDGTLQLKLHTTNVDTKEHYQRDFSLSTAPAEPHETPCSRT